MFASLGCLCVVVCSSRQSQGALAVDPGNPDLLCKRAQAFLKLQNYEAAEVDLAAALRKRPGDPVLLYLR